MIVVNKLIKDAVLTPNAHKIVNPQVSAELNIKAVIVVPFPKLGKKVEIAAHIIISNDRLPIHDETQYPHAEVKPI
jgi:hypothetical protein